jgi:hypothetical protein
LKEQHCDNVQDQNAWEKIPLGGKEAINADERCCSGGGRKTVTIVAEIRRTSRKASAFVLFDLTVVALFKDFYSGVASSVETPNEKEFDNHLNKKNCCKYCYKSYRIRDLTRPDGQSSTRTIVHDSRWQDLKTP